MKHRNRIVAYMALSLLFASCSATNTLTMGALEPAPVHLSKDIARIGIINRSLPSEGNKQIDQIDKILSAEGLNLDRKGSETAISALYNELVRDSRFEEVKMITDAEEVRKGLGVFPAALSWETVEALCEANGVDALFSLAFYDTDTKASYEMTTAQLPNSFGIKVNVPAHKVSLNTRISNGWRIYDPKNRAVLDEFTFNEHIVSVGKGINPVKAVEAVLGRNEAVMQYSQNMGSAYGLRLLPYKLRVTRNYFVRGTDNFVIGKRRAQTGDWDGAAKLWEQELASPNPKIAGRACYNMAIINEINGDLGTAMDWASKSYTDYRIKDALRYLNTLKYRYAQNQALEQQASR